MQVDPESAVKLERGLKYLAESNALNEPGAGRQNCEPGMCAQLHDPEPVDDASRVVVSDATLAWHVQRFPPKTAYFGDFASTYERAMSVPGCRMARQGKPTCKFWLRPGRRRQAKGVAVREKNRAVFTLAVLILTILVPTRWSVRAAMVR